MINLYYISDFNAILLFISVTALLILFYYFFKLEIFKISPSIALKTNLINIYPLTQVVGAIELSSVAILHVVFCIFLSLIFKLNLYNIFLNTSPVDCLYGALIGIGCVGVSVLICGTGIKIVELIGQEKAPKSMDEWYAISGAGWIRHHKHTIKTFPVAIALLIITLQIGSEETIFRSILIQIFEPYGIWNAFTISTILFIAMQIFHMPNLISAMFPIIGATVMGTVHGLLYIHHPSITPLIISHLTFFMFTVM